MGQGQVHVQGGLTGFSNAVNLAVYLGASPLVRTNCPIPEDEVMESKYSIFLMCRELSFHVPFVYLLPVQVNFWKTFLIHFIFIEYFNFNKDLMKVTISRHVGRN